LAITKEFQGECIPGETQTFLLTIDNVGNADTGGPIIVTDTLPAGLTLVSVNAPGWMCVEAPLGTITCTFDGLVNPLEPNEPPLVIAVLVNILPPAAPAVTNTANVGTDGDINLVNNTDSDLCTSLPPAPAPLLSPLGMAIASLTLLAVAYVAVRRRRWDLTKG
jgi:large repetitive protein